MLLIQYDLFGHIVEKAPNKDLVEKNQCRLHNIAENTLLIPRQTPVYDE
jgi:hypothetical protein